MFVNKAFQLNFKSEKYLNIKDGFYFSIVSVFSYIGDVYILIEGEDKSGYIQTQVLLYKKGELSLIFTEPII
jgi:hypothetical protein